MTNTLVKKVGFFFGLLLLILPLTLFAQTAPEENFSKQIELFNNHLTSVTAGMRGKAVNISELLARAPIRAETFEASMADLNNANFNKETALTKAQAFAEQLKQAQTVISAEQSRLNDLNSAVEALSIDAEKLKQRLNNPISKAELTEDEQTQLLQLLQQTEQLRVVYAQNQQAAATHQQTLKASSDVLKRWISVLTEKLSDAKAEQANLSTQQAKLAAKRQAFEKEADELQTQLDKNIVLLSNEQIVAAQEQIDQALTQAWLADIDMKIGAIMINRVPTHAVNAATGVAELTEQLQTSKQHIADLKALQNQLNERAELLKKHDALMGSSPQLAAAITSSQQMVAYHLLKQETLPKRISDLLLSKNQSAILQRQPWLSGNSLLKARQKASESLLQIAFQLKISVQTLWQSIIKKPIVALLSAAASALCLWIGLQLARRLTTAKLQTSAYERWVVTSLQKMLATLGALRYWIASILFLMMLVRLLHVPSPSDDILLWVASCVLIALVGFMMLIHEWQSKNPSKNLLLQGFIWFSYLITTALFYGLAKFSLVASAVMVLSEQALMLALIGVSVTLYRMARYQSRHERLATREKLYNRYRQLLMALPLTGALIGAISLLGYQVLAWLSLKYLGIFTIFWAMVIVGIVVINHLRKFSKLYCAKRFQRGAFIAQDIISPLSAISKLAWLYLAGYWLVTVSDWDSNSYVVTQVLTMLETPLLTFGESSINLKILGLTLVALFLIFRIARWLKRFAYHWLFARVKDLGIRNSLAIFGQYLFTLCGILLTLNVLGIDLTSLAVFAGALGVGIGLGLQDIAKSFISGIILLIERPLRTGDWVELDNKEGYVRSIGLRAITLETFDKQEVIIPNGNAINNSFTNYTHSSDINRTVLYVGAGYSTPPKQVLALLETLINSVDGVLTNPKAQAAMWEYADSCINYRIQYFIDVHKSNLLDVKTGVLSAIWYAFEENGIEIPFPQRDIHFKNILLTKQEDNPQENNPQENNPQESKPQEKELQKEELQD